MKKSVVLFKDEETSNANRSSKYASSLISETYCGSLKEIMTKKAARQDE